MSTTYDKKLWCADATPGDDLPSNMGTIEIAGESSFGVNIQPGYNGNAAYNASRDGETYVVPTPSPGDDDGVACAVFWNWAMKPGWQKWRPNYRYGEIGDIDYDADTCEVALDELNAIDYPDGKPLDINQTDSLSGVAIEYMGCNSAAFEIGDRVIVKFENNDWNSPKVIGFESEPKGCGWHEQFTEGGCVNNFNIYSINILSQGVGSLTEETPEAPWMERFNIGHDESEVLYCDTMEATNLLESNFINGEASINFVDCNFPNGDSGDKAAEFHSYYAGGNAYYLYCVLREPGFSEYDYTRISSNIKYLGTSYKQKSESPYLWIKSDAIHYPPSTVDSVEQVGWGEDYTEYNCKSIRIYAPKIEINSDKSHMRYGFSMIRVSYRRADDSWGAFNVYLWAKNERAAVGDEDPAYTYSNDYYYGPVIPQAGEYTFNFEDWDELIGAGSRVYIPTDPYGYNPMVVYTQSIASLPYGSVVMYPGDPTGGMYGFNVTVQLADIKLF